MSAVVVQGLRAALLVAAAAVSSAWAAWSDENTFQEASVPPPAQFQTERLVEFKLTDASELRVGVVPETVSVGADGVVRYVLVARGSGARNVLFQGLRCDRGEFKTYALWHEGAGWQASQGADWASWSGNGAGLPARRLAREGFCSGKLANTPVSTMLQQLRYGRPSSP